MLPSIDRREPMECLSSIDGPWFISRKGHSGRTSQASHADLACPRSTRGPTGDLLASSSSIVAAPRSQAHAHRPNPRSPLSTEVSTWSTRAPRRKGGHGRRTTHHHKTGSDLQSRLRIRTRDLRITRIPFTTKGMLTASTVRLDRFTVPILLQLLAPFRSTTGSTPPSRPLAQPTTTESSTRLAEVGCSGSSPSLSWDCVVRVLRRVSALAASAGAGGTRRR